MKKSRYRLLQWFFDFRYGNIDQLEPKDLDAISHALGLLIHRDTFGDAADEMINGFLDSYTLSRPGRKNMASGKELGRETEKQIAVLKMRQTAFRLVFDQLFDAISDLPGDDAPTTDPLRTPRSVGPIFYNLASHLAPMSQQMVLVNTVPDTQIKNAMASTEGHFFAKGYKKDARFHIHILPQDADAQLASIFIRELNGLPLNIFHQCPACGHWFIHYTQKKREFCSHGCAARISNRRRRAAVRADPEKYQAELEAGKRRSRKSYRKKCGLPVKDNQ